MAKLRIKTVVAGSLGIVAAATAIVAFVECLDPRTSRCAVYQDLAAVRGTFADYPGLMPAFLPGSSRNIRHVRHLDNFSAIVRFEFSSSEPLKLPIHSMLLQPSDLEGVAPSWLEEWRVWVPRWLRHGDGKTMGEREYRLYRVGEPEGPTSDAGRVVRWYLVINTNSGNGFAWH